MSDRGVGELKQHKEFYLRDGNICFLVENTMFRIHKYFFERESDYFRERFQTLDEANDGSVDKPYIIRDAKSDEFAQFIWVWYNPQYSFSKQTKSKWLTILRLATKWRFPDVRQLAIRQLEKMKLEPVEKITTYKQYSVESELLLPSYVSLCRSPTLPSPEEGKLLTMETVLQLASARERVLLRASELGTPSPADTPDELVRAIVAELFGLKLHPDTLSNALEHSAAPDVVTVKQPDPNKKGKLNGTQVPLQNGLQSNGAGGNASKGKNK